MTADKEVLTKYPVRFWCEKNYGMSIISESRIQM